MSAEVLPLNDIEQSNYLQWNWLGRDLQLENGDIVFGPDGDILSHTDPIQSFSSLLKYKSQVAGSLVQDSFPHRIHTAISAAVNAMRTDPRVRSVKILNGKWRVSDTTTTPEQEDMRFYIIIVRIVLESGDILDNLSLPVRYDGASQ